MRSIQYVLPLLLTLLSAVTLLAQAPTRGEYFFDDLTAYGGGIPFTLASGETDFSIPTADLPAGVHRLFVRVRDQAGRWSQTQSHSVYIKHPQPIALVRGEYFIDVTGSPGTGTPIALPSSGQISADFSQTIPTANLEEGLHRLFFRFTDELGNWSQLANYAFLVKHQRTVPIVAGEYFVDVAGDFGTGTPLTFTATADSALTTSLDLPADLPDGEYTIFFRYRDADGKWSHLQSSSLCVRPVSNSYVATDQTKLSVSPNPSGAGFVELDLNEPTVSTVRIFLYDQLGRTYLRNVELNGFPASGYRLAVHDYPPGVYLLTVETKEGRYRKKLLLQ